MPTSIRFEKHPLRQVPLSTSACHFPVYVDLCRTGVIQVFCSLIRNYFDLSRITDLLSRCLVGISRFSEHISRISHHISRFSLRRAETRPRMCAPDSSASPTRPHAIPQLFKSISSAVPNSASGMPAKPRIIFGDGSASFSSR
ncbi:hypothetical protein JNUCC1_01591 [Lentibacillus sp. JNUCC-1]|nr:hypothetical protein [Lentibacillus sp. JNUCC-1]